MMNIYCQLINIENLLFLSQVKWQVIATLAMGY
ncbi:MAG: hypothetical protein RL422_120 [Bacteroidota bacterium]|jgi:hypothetical protein